MSPKKKKKKKRPALACFANAIPAYLRLRGIDARRHPVFRELTRVRQYFDKIKGLETGPEKRNLTLDKAAAGRFIKHGLVSHLGPTPIIYFTGFEE